MPDDPRYWLLAGETPTGPFTTAQIHEQLASGSLTWQIKACRVGEAVWLPLLNLPGIGPMAPGAESAAHNSTPGTLPEAEPTPVSIPSAPDTANNLLTHEAALQAANVPIGGPNHPATSALESRPAPNESVIPATGTAGSVVGGLIVITLLGGLGAYCLWWLFFPLSPRQVVERLHATRSAAEAKRYATDRMHPLFTQPGFFDETPGDEEVITGDYAVPGRSNEHYVGSRVRVFDQDLGRRVDAECLYHLVDKRGWKIDDIYIIRYDGISPERPLSILELIPGMRGRVDRPSLGADVLQQARGWFETTPNKGLFAGIAFFALLKSGAFKAVLAGLVALGAAVAAWRKRSKSGRS